MKSSTMSGALKFATVIYLLFSVFGITWHTAIGFCSHWYFFVLAFADGQLLWEILCFIFIALFLAVIVGGISAIFENRYKLYTFLVWTDCLATLALVLTGIISFTHSIWIDALYGTWLLWELHLDHKCAV